MVKVVVRQGNQKYSHLKLLTDGVEWEREGLQIAIKKEITTGYQLKF